jgi:hypothetical protein
MDFHPGHPPPTPPSLAFKFEPRRNFASNRAYHFAMSQHARAELLQLTKSSGAPIVSPHNDGRLEMWRMDSQQSYHRISDLSPFNYDLTESHSRANSSGHHSTPSDYYDEDAENIDPNSLQRKDHQTHHPLSVHSRPTNILCDSQAYPVASNIDLPQSQRVDTDPIAAPVPLPYSARSKEVLSAMISPVQPSGFPSKEFKPANADVCSTFTEPVSQEPSSSENLVAYTQSAYILPVCNISSSIHFNVETRPGFRDYHKIQLKCPSWPTLQLFSRDGTIHCR